MAKKIPKNFWQMEMGAEMISTARSWNMAIEKHDRDARHELQSRWEAFEISFRYMFGIEIFFTRTDEYFGICTEDEHFFYREER